MVNLLEPIPTVSYGPNRVSVVRFLLPAAVGDLMDVGCGAITPQYPYADKALRVTCIDWKPVIIGSTPPNVVCIKGDFTKMDLSPDRFDAIIAADVFEHVPLEREAAFAERCTRALKPGGSLILSVPHDGTFA